MECLLNFQKFCKKQSYIVLYLDGKITTQMTNTNLILIYNINSEVD